MRSCKIGMSFLSYVFVLFLILFQMGCSNEFGLLDPYAEGDFDICEMAIHSDGGSVGYCLAAHERKIWVIFDAALTSERPCTFQVIREGEAAVQDVQPNSSLEKDIVGVLKGWLDVNVHKGELSSFFYGPPQGVSQGRLIYAYSIWHSLKLIEDRDESPYCVAH